MTKKGIMLIIVLIILLLGIIISGTLQSYKVNKEIKNQNIEEIKDNEINKFTLEVTADTGFDLEKLKSYGLPILIQIGSSKDDAFNNMKSDLEILNEEIKGKAILKYIDIDKYKQLWEEDAIPLNDAPMQILIDNNGMPYKTTASEVFGYKIIKDTAGNHIYTIHDGEFTLNDMRNILVEMGMKLK